MRIGLARHFPVVEPLPSGWRTCAELLAWRRRYDEAAVNAVPVADESHRWARCYTSDLNRAAVTAQAMYRGEIIPLSALREAEFGALPLGSLRLPVWAWLHIMRVVWMSGHASQRHLRDDFFSRVRSVADLVESQPEDLLIVSHAGMMLYLRKELIRRGFHGPEFGIADHARVYLFAR